jgi:hypothetical protein
MGDVDHIEAENRENVKESMDIDNELPVTTKTDDTLKEGLLKEKQIVEMLIGSL